MLGGEAEDPGWGDCCSKNCFLCLASIKLLLVFAAATELFSLGGGPVYAIATAGADLSCKVPKLLGGNPPCNGLPRIAADSDGGTTLRLYCLAP